MFPVKKKTFQSIHETGSRVEGLNLISLGMLDRLASPTR